MLRRMLDGLYLSITWVKMNALNKFHKIFKMVKFFVGKNFLSVIIFVSKYFRHLTKILSLFTSNNFTDKVIRNLHSEIKGPRIDFDHELYAEVSSLQ